MREIKKLVGNRGILAILVDMSTYINHGCLEVLQSVSRPWKTKLAYKGQNVQNWTPKKMFPGHFPYFWYFWFSIYFPNKKTHFCKRLHENESNDNVFIFSTANLSNFCFQTGCFSIIHCTAALNSIQQILKVSYWDPTKCPSSHLESILFPCWFVNFKLS